MSVNKAGERERARDEEAPPRTVEKSFSLGRVYALPLRTPRAAFIRKSLSAVEGTRVYPRWWKKYWNAKLKGLAGDAEAAGWKVRWRCFESNVIKLPATASFWKGERRRHEGYYCQIMKTKPRCGNLLLFLYTPEGLVLGITGFCKG